MTSMTKRRVAIVAGHGMGNKKKGVFDPGFVFLGSRESDRALEFAQRGKQILIQHGIPVYMVRPDNVQSIHLSERPRMAYRAGCDLLIDIHFNAGGTPYVTSGTEVFYRDTKDKVWGQEVLECAISAFGLRNRGMKHESVSAVKSLGMFDSLIPVALLEVGFLHTPNIDMRRIRDSKRLTKFWELLSDRILSMDS